MAVTNVKDLGVTHSNTLYILLLHKCIAERRQLNGEKETKHQLATQDELDSQFNPAQPTHDQQENEAVTIIDQIPKDASNIDLLPPKTTKEDQFNRATITALEAVMTSTQQETNVQNLTPQEARTLMHCIVEGVEKKEFSVACLAPTGIATSTLPRGKARTIHNYLGINPMAKCSTYYSFLQGEQLLRYRSRLK